MREMAVELVRCSLVVGGIHKGWWRFGGDGRRFSTPNSAGDGGASYSGSDGKRREVQFGRPTRAREAGDGDSGGRRVWFRSRGRRGKKMAALIRVRCGVGSSQQENDEACGSLARLHANFWKMCTLTPQSLRFSILSSKNTKRPPLTNIITLKSTPVIFKLLLSIITSL